MATYELTYFDLSMKLNIRKFVIFFHFWMKIKSMKLKEKAIVKSSHPFSGPGTHGFRCADHARIVLPARRVKSPCALVRSAESNALRIAARINPDNRENPDREDRNKTKADTWSFSLMALFFGVIRHDTRAFMGSNLSSFDPNHYCESADSKEYPGSGYESVAGGHVIEMRAVFTRRGRASSRRIEFGLRFAYDVMEKKGGENKMIYLIKKIVISVMLLEVIINLITKILIIVYIIQSILIYIALFVLIYCIIKSFVSKL